ncbi:MAG: permease [Candidatus Methylacidiphilales bacterium]|nr:permease [Candidatus Methylacidiphilales bacterium]
MSDCCSSQPKLNPTPSPTPSCCGGDHGTPPPSPNHDGGDCCGSTKRTFDWLLWGSFALAALAYSTHLAFPHLHDTHARLGTFTHGVFDLLNQMWWGLALGIVAVGLLGKVPRETVMGLLGPGGRINGILRAVGAGLLLDLCNHGILLVAMKLYERGASVGQVMAFLIASPWNSFSLTIILFSLIGWKWTVLFIAGSAVIALLSGLIFDRLVASGILPANPHTRDLPENYSLVGDAKARLRTFRPGSHWIRSVLVDGIRDSRMIVRWILFGSVLAALLRAVLPMEFYQTWFGPTIGGLLLTLLAATIIEVCSEGSTPIAADLVTRAGAPGGGFTFLMAGAATDYTEIMALKQTTGSWKIALFLPLVTVPQVLLLGWIMNRF